MRRAGSVRGAAGAAALPDVHFARMRRKRKTRAARLLAAFLTTLDPRVYLHALRLLHYYNYTHVQPLRRMRRVPGTRIAPNVSIGNPDRLTIGSRVHIGARCTLWAGPTSGRIVISDGCVLGPDVFITAANYRFEGDTHVFDQGSDEADIFIGERAWLGARVIVLPGARIGRRCIIGAGSVVTRPIPDGAVAVGAPAHVVRRVGSSGGT
jgi:acetyltransferase-like isoleucine patch superfamily enzyme